MFQQLGSNSDLKDRCNKNLLFFSVKNHFVEEKKNSNANGLHNDNNYYFVLLFLFISCF